MQLSFCKDSVLNWNIHNTYDLHSVKFKYEGQTYYFIPGTKISYNDSIYNQFPCMIAKGEIKQGWLNNGKSMVYILKDNSSKEYSIFINENGIHEPTLDGNALLGSFRSAVFHIAGLQHGDDRGVVTSTF